MVHECRMQGAGDPSYYDRVPKLKQSMCGGIGRRLVAREQQDKATMGRGHISRRPLLIMSGANPDHMHSKSM